MIKIAYLDINSVTLLDTNPKKHELDKLKLSFKKNGFRDAPIIDKTIATVVAGNGRVTALRLMKANGLPAPEGVIAEGEHWFAPFQVGTGSSSVAEAVSFAIDHNNTTLTGGDFTLLDISKIWNSGYIRVLADLISENGALVTVDGDDLDALFYYASLVPDPNKPDFTTPPHDAIKVIVNKTTELKQVIEAIKQEASMHADWNLEVT